MTEPLPPGPTEYTPWGNVVSLLHDPRRYAERVAEKYGDVASYRHIPREIYLLSHPDHVRTVLVSEDDKFKKKTTLGDGKNPVFRDGVVTSKGERWQTQRRRLGEHLRPDVAREYAPKLAAETREQTASWSETESVELLSEASTLTVRLIGAALLGAEMDGPLGEMEDPMLGLQSGHPLWEKLLIRFLPSVSTPGQERMKEHNKKLDELIYELIEQRRGEGADGDDALSMLIGVASAGMIEESDIRDQLVSLLYAGHGNTAMLLGYALTELAHRPALQRRVRSEVRSVTDGNGVEPDHVDALETTRHVLKETLRLYPPVVTIQRVTATDVAVDGYRIPAGEEVELGMWLIQRDERFWDAPEQFDPDRWARSVDRPNYAYAPFGAGRRRCPAKTFSMAIGAVAVATILDAFELEPLFDEPTLEPNASVPNDPPHEVVARPRDG